jgi:hypothetical protein
MAYRIDQVDRSSNAVTTVSIEKMKRNKGVRRHSVNDGLRDQIDLGDSFVFDAYQNASGKVKASVSLGVDQMIPYILITYSKFSMHMRHDPSIYTFQTSLESVQGTDYLTQTYNADGTASTTNTIMNTPSPVAVPSSSSSSSNSCSLRGIALIFVLALVACTVSLRIT